MALRNCPECKGEYSTKAAACPKCGWRPRRSVDQLKVLCMLVVVVVGLLFIFGVLQ